MGVTIGGDESVAWTIRHVDKFEFDDDGEKGKLHERHPDKHAVNLAKNDGFVEGRDPKNTNGLYFQVTIAVPTGKDGRDFIEGLKTAAAGAKEGAQVSFKLAIISKTYKQIEIDWAYTETGDTAV